MHHEGCYCCISVSLDYHLLVPEKIPFTKANDFSKRLFSSLPYHLVVGLPALSPTMESGSLAEWYVAEGESFSAGKAIAKIETDKASIDFEAQDDGFVAKLLASTGVDLTVGTPIMVTVEDEEDVAAFKDFVLETIPTSDPVVEAPAPVPAATQTPPIKQKPLVSANPSRPTSPVPVELAVPSVSVSSDTSATVSWGFAAKDSSPLASTMAGKQKSYIELYGTTGQRPIS